MGSVKAPAFVKGLLRQRVENILKVKKVIMVQSSGPIVPHQVIQIIEESREKAWIKDNYYEKAAKVLGVIQIICGIIALAIFITGINTFSFGKGIWTFTLFFFSGLLTISVAQSKNSWLITASMVMAINSATSAGFLLINVGISHGFGYDYGYNGNIAIGSNSEKYSSYGGISDYSNQNYQYMADVMIVVMAWTMLMVSTASVLLTCFTHQCPPSSVKSKLRESGRLVQYNSSQQDLTNHQDLHTSPIQPNSTNPTNLEDLPDQPSLDGPPTYQEVTGLRVNC